MKISILRDKTYSIVYPGSDAEDMQVEEVMGCMIRSFCDRHGLTVGQIAIFQGPMLKHWDDDEDIKVV